MRGPLSEKKLASVRVGTKNTENAKKKHILQVVISRV